MEHHEFDRVIAYLIEGKTHRQAVKLIKPIVGEERAEQYLRHLVTSGVLYEHGGISKISAPFLRAVNSGVKFI